MKNTIITLFFFFLISFSNSYAVDFTNRIDFENIIAQRDHDKSISKQRRVFNLSSIYKAFCDKRELAVFNYYRNSNIIDKSYILETTTNNHWIQLVFNSSEKPQIKISLIDSSINPDSIQLYNLDCNYNVKGGNIYLTLNRSNQKGMIIINGNEQEPLFIFADSPINYRNDIHTKIFNGYNHFNYILPKGIDTVVLSLGSYFVGNISSNHKFRVIGHGIISQEGVAHKAYMKGEDNQGKCNVASDDGAAMYINGITSIEPCMYQFWAWPCKGIEYEHVKCLGFQYESDSFVGDKITDCFSKGNDDHVKLYHSNIKVNNLTIYQQGNGFAFQFGWGDYGSRENINVENVVLLRDLNNKPSEYCRAFINWRKPDYNNTLRNVKISNVIAFDKIKKLFSVIQNDESTHPTFLNFELSNFKLPYGMKYPIEIIGGNGLKLEMKNIIIGNCKLDNKNKKEFINEKSIEHVKIDE